MSADDIVTLNISLASKATSQAGFGRPLFLSSEATYVGRTKLYTASTGLADMLVDGFSANGKTYRDVQTLLSQKPCPVDFKIGKRTLKPTSTVNLIPTVTTQGFVYSGEISCGTAWIAFSYTVLAAATVATISTALAALIGALSAGVTASGASTTWCALTATATGKPIQVRSLVPELNVADVTTDPGVATDLAAVVAADNDWFGLLLDSNSKAEVMAAAAYIETKRKLFFVTTSDSATQDPSSTTDVIYLMKALAYFNTAVFYHHDVNGGMAAAPLGSFLTTVPGAATLAHLAVIGVAPSDVAGNGSPYCTAAEQNAVQGKNGNTYITLGSQGDVYPGKVVGGDFVDNVRFIHFMFARIQETFIDLLQGLSNAGSKLPMTDKGISKAKNTLLNLLNGWCKPPYNALDNSPDYAPTVSAPALADISLADKAARKLPDVRFGARLQGAIHLFQISGVVTI
jgi:hypothetical protein